MKIFGGLLIGYLNACGFGSIQEEFDDLAVKVDENAAALEALKLRAKAMENSLVNNNLLTQCTYQGSTDQWAPTNDALEGSFFVKGKNITVEFLSFHKSFKYIKLMFPTLNWRKLKALIHG